MTHFDPLGTILYVFSPIVKCFFVFFSFIFTCRHKRKIPAFQRGFSKERMRIKCLDNWIYPAFLFFRMVMSIQRPKYSVTLFSESWTFTTWSRNQWNSPSAHCQRYSV